MILKVEKILSNYIDDGLLNYFGIEYFDINQKGLLGDGLLHTAVLQENLEDVKCLFEAGADINLQGEDGNTALHYAFMTKNKEIQQFLIENGADSTIKNDFGKSLEKICLQLL